jgi:bacterioferritin-associated ferredoxin
MYICICNAVTEREIRQCAQLGASSLGELRECLGVASNCGQCKQAARQILREERSASGASGRLQSA